MTISRQFNALVSVPFCLVIGLAISLTVRVAGLTSSIAGLISDLQRTTTLNQQLMRGNNEQTSELRRQFDLLEPSFPERSRALNYRLGLTCAEYLKLDIDQRERLTVERIKGLQDELGVLATHLYGQLQAGNRVEAMRRLDGLYQVERQLRSQFDILAGFQVGRLQGLVEELRRTTRFGFIAATALVAALLFVLFASTFLLRRRILEPVRKLLDASDRIRRGDLAARAAVVSSDELGALTRGFNFMAESLADSYATLERRVDERTRQLREAQGHLVQAEKMSAVGLLVSGVAHELNNPLAAIMGATELARIEMAGGDQAAAGRALEDMDAHVERCRRIVANLLQFARGPEPLVEFVRVNETVEQALQLRQYELATHNVGLIRDLDPSDPVVHGDRFKIQQVLLNLLNNAHDAIGETGRAGAIRVSTRAASGKLVLRMSDDGPGFRDPARAFDPFYTTKPPGKGTGLGLSVCYGIVKEHGGEITARNLGRAGAEVTVVLPLAEKPPARLRGADPPARPTEAEGAGGRGVDPPARPTQAEGAGLRGADPPARPTQAEGAAGRRVVLPAPPGDQASGEPGARRPLALVVDDEESLLRLQVSFLERSGIAAAAVTTGEEAVRYLQAHEVDLIVSDVRMPGAVDGPHLLDWVRQHQPRLAARFIFVSGDVLGFNLGDLAPSTARIAKPFRYQEYDRVVRRVLQAGEGTT